MSATPLQLEAPVWGKVVVRPGCPLVWLRLAIVTSQFRCLCHALPSILLFDALDHVSHEARGPRAVPLAGKSSPPVYRFLRLGGCSNLYTG